MATLTNGMSASSSPQFHSIQTISLEMIMGAKVLRSLFKLEGSDDRSAFNPTRLSLARKRKGLSKLAFAKTIRVDRKSVEAYEAGKTTPSAETISEIVRVLEFPREFFMGDDL